MTPNVALFQYTVAVLSAAAADETEQNAMSNGPIDLIKEVRLMVLMSMQNTAELLRSCIEIPITMSVTCARLICEFRR